MSDLQSKFDQLIAEQQELQKKFQEQGQALFKETFKEFFAKNPGVKAVIWTQYTPYFNDGDECIFSVNQPTYTNAEGDDLDDVHAYGEYDGENEAVWASDDINYTLTCDREYYKEEAEKIRSGGAIDLPSCNLLSQMLQSSEMESIMKAMFDDHSQVIATVEGFNVQEYEHD